MKQETVVIERDFTASIERVFQALINPEDLVKWHHAGDGWQTPYAEVDAKVGGIIKIAYAGPDGKVVFDLIGTIEALQPPHTLSYRLAIPGLPEQDRIVNYTLSATPGGTHLRLEFDIEHINDIELQRKGWTEHIINLEAMLEILT